METCSERKAFGMRIGYTDPTYKEWKREIEEQRQRASSETRILPTRNGNNISSVTYKTDFCSHGSYLQGMETINQRVCLGGHGAADTDPTYKEWKPQKLSIAIIVHK